MKDHVFAKFKLFFYYFLVMKEDKLYENCQTNFWIFLIQIHAGKDVKRFVKNFYSDYEEMLKEYKLEVKNLDIVYGEYDVFLSLSYDPDYLLNKFGKNMIKISGDVYDKIRKHKDVALVDMLYPIYGCIK